MKLTPLQFSFCVSVLVHGAAISVFYVTRHVSVDAKPAPAVEDLGMIGILVEPEPNVISVSEPQPVKILEPAPQPLPSTLSMAPETKPEVAAVEIISPARQENPVTALAPQTAITTDESKSVPLEIPVPAIIPSQASYLSNPKPTYPKEARQRKEQGLVVLGVTITQTGHPADVWVIQSSGYALLDKSAQTAIKGWQFVPARVGNVAVSSQVQVPVRFRLSD